MTFRFKPISILMLGSKHISYPPKNSHFILVGVFAEKYGHRRTIILDRLTSTTSITRLSLLISAVRATGEPSPALSILPFSAIELQTSQSALPQSTQSSFAVVYIAKQNTENAHNKAIIRFGCFLRFFILKNLSFT